LNDSVGLNVNGFDISLTLKVKNVPASKYSADRSSGRIRT